MEPGAIPFAVTIWLCGLVFIAIGIYALKRKSPMHFWAGTTVKSDEISDIKAYNKANGIMWLIYGSGYIVSGLLALTSSVFIGTIISLALSVPGIIVLIIVYTRIYNKYKV